jgi:hypothetical protein
MKRFLLKRLRRSDPIRERSPGKRPSGGERQATRSQLVSGTVAHGASAAQRLPQFSECLRE